MNEAQNINQFQFHNPEYLYGLLILLIPILVFIISNIMKKAQLKEFGDYNLVKQLMPDASKTRQFLKFLFATLALAMIIIAIARPQYGGEKRTVEKESSEIIIALDVSNSMLAEDLKPNRLEKAKKAIKELLKETNYSNRVGLIVFAGDAYTQIPISSDYGAAELFLSVVSPDIVPSQGTNLKAAIELAQNSFSPVMEEGKALIIISDGEDHEQAAIEAAKNIRKKGIKIYTIGMGGKRAVPIIDPKTGDYRKNRNGKKILTKLNDKLLKQIAKAGDGIYTAGNHINSAISNVTNELNKAKKSKSEEDIYKYDEKYHYPIAAALLFLIPEFFLLERKNKYLKNIRLFD